MAKLKKSYVFIAESRGTTHFLGIGYGSNPEEAFKSIDEYKDFLLDYEDDAISSYELTSDHYVILDTNSVREDEGDDQDETYPEEDDEDCTPSDNNKHRE